MYIEDAKQKAVHWFCGFSLFWQYLPICIWEKPGQRQLNKIFKLWAISHPHCPKNNLNLCIDTICSFADGADATIYVCPVYVPVRHIYTETRHISLHPHQYVTGSVVLRRLRLFLGQCTSTAYNGLLKLL